jgi:glycerol uptake facilitator-like aquaporin
MKIKREYWAECLGTAGLMATVIGSGIMAEQLSAGNVAIALLANTLATVFGLYVLIELFAPISDAHFNPLMSVIAWLNGKLNKQQLIGYVLSQIIGGMIAIIAVHAMFGLDLYQVATKPRLGLNLWVAEMIATAGLVIVALNAPAYKAAACVSCYIGAAYWFTASTSFANPIADMTRMMTNTFTGISPSSVLGFMVAQCFGAIIGYMVSTRLLK